MKKLIYLGVGVGVGVALTLSSVSFAPLTLASDVHSGAHPANARVRNATHHFEYHVREKALSELTIQIPNAITFKGIDVEDSSGKLFDTQVSIDYPKATIVFSQPVPPNTSIFISLRRVNTSNYDAVWQYKLFGKLVGINEEVPLGFARIQTYY